MAVSKAPPHSAVQQQLVLKMAETAANGKELLMAMRAGMGVFPPHGGSSDRDVGTRVRSTVTAKMVKVATLNQLMEYAARYVVDPENARPLVERMCELGGSAPDPQIWLRIHAAAARFNLSDLERLAQARGERLTPN